MKQVTAIIRMNMMNATKQALIEAGFPAFTVRKVLGRGKGNVGYRGAQDLYDRIVNTLLEVKQDTSTVGYAYL